ncbi:mucin-2-like [Saccostrea echinata]|uniref:mucin-2-like n=1 Tax=Saccostrea echinata TaxID=191078 RepID=UPI002A804D13|nr:mucin-2-like [Saccostrea echinata]
MRAPSNSDLNTERAEQSILRGVVVTTTINVPTTTIVSTTSTATVSMTPSSTTVYESTICVNITVTATETAYHNLTTYIPETTISYIQSHFTATMTTVVPTTVIMTSYIAPSTVTVEVTPLLTTCNNQTKFINITNTQYIQEAVENITKALYVDKTTISSYVRSKTCAEDDRTSSATVGYFGIVFIAVPFGLIFLLDLHQVYLQLSETVRQCCRKDR